MKALPASLSALWIVAAAGFSGSAQAQSHQRVFETFMHPPEFSCSATTSQLRMDSIDAAAIKILSQNSHQRAEAESQGKELPRVTLVGVTGTVGEAVRDANIMWMNQMRAATTARDGIEEQTHLLRAQNNGSYALRVYQDSKGNLGAARELVDPLKQNIEGFKATATLILIEARRLAKQVCDKVRKDPSVVGYVKGKPVFHPIFTSGRLRFEDTLFDPFRKKFSGLLDFAGAPREGTPNPPALTPEKATLTRQAMYILGLSDDAPGKFGPVEKGTMQAELIKETGMKISKTGKPDRKVGPLTAAAAWRFLQRAYN